MASVCTAPFSFSIHTSSPKVVLEYDNKIYKIIDIQLFVYICSYYVYNTCLCAILGRGESTMTMTSLQLMRNDNDMKRPVRAKKFPLERLFSQLFS